MIKLLLQEENNNTSTSGQDDIIQDQSASSGQDAIIQDQSVPTEPSIPSEQPVAQSINVQTTQSNSGNPRRNQNKRKKTTSNNTEDIISDETLSEAFQILQQCAQPPQPETDVYIAFGQYISNELRKYDPITLAYVKQAISHIIFEADTGRYGPENYGYYSTNPSYSFTARSTEPIRTSLPSSSTTLTTNPTAGSSEPTPTPPPSSSTATSTISQICTEMTPAPQSPLI